MPDEQAYVSPYRDDESIADSDRLYRRVPPNDVKPQESLSNGPGVSTRAFQDATPDWAAAHGYPAPGMSVGLASELEGHGYGPEKMLEGCGPGWGLAELAVEPVRAAGEIGVVREPTDHEPWHAMVFAKDRPRLSNGQRSRIRDSVVRWAVVPDTGEV